MRVVARTARGETKKPSSRYFGVHFTKRENKWTAQYRDNGRVKIIAVCDDELTAARAYAAWAKPLGRPYTLVAL